MRVLLSYLLCMVLTWGMTGCRRDQTSSIEDLTVTEDRPLTVSECAVENALCELAKRKSERCDIDQFRKEARPFFLQEGLDRRKILYAFQKIVLSLPIERRVGEMPKGTTWNKSFGVFLHQAYFAVSLRTLIPGNELEFEDLVFDFNVGRRLRKELSAARDLDDGRWSVTTSPFDEWMDGAFYREGSDLYVYCLKASPEERERVLSWFVKQGGKVPDWVH